jgi:hypothetical protein
MPLPPRAAPGPAELANETRGPFGLSISLGCIAHRVGYFEQFVRDCIAGKYGKCYDSEAISLLRTDNDKPIARWGNKAMGFQQEIARLPKASVMRMEAFCLAAA